MQYFYKGTDEKKWFYYNGKEIENVKTLNNLELYFHHRVPLFRQKKYATERATKAMYRILKNVNQLHLSLDDQLHLFDKIVVPLLLYGCEVWGYSNVDIMERIHV